MNRTRWFVGGGVVLACGFAAVWLSGLPRPSAAVPDARTVAPPDRTASAHRLSGEEAQEAPAEVIEVIDLSEVFEPGVIEGDQPAADFGATVVDSRAGTSVGVGGGLADRTPRVMPLAADARRWEDGPMPRVARFPLRYGEETSEPPAFTGVAQPDGRGGRIGAFCVELMYRLMPLKGAASPSPDEE